MKKVFLFTVSTLTIFVNLFLFSKNSNAVYFASDSVSVYANGKKIKNDSMIFATSNKNYTEKCSRGICRIGQQFYPVTIYTAKNDSVLLTYNEFNSQYPYQGDENDSSAKYKWKTKNKKDYINYLDKNSKYSTYFDPGPSEGGEGCGSPDCIGGRVGDPRSYSLEITNGDYEETSYIKEHKKILSTRNIVVFFLFSIAIFSLALHITKKPKDKN